MYGVNSTTDSYEAAHSLKLWGYPYVEYPIANTYEVDPAIVIIVYEVGVNFTAHSYEAAHSKKLWVYPYVEYPIASTYEVDPMALSHIYQSTVWSWSEPYDTRYEAAHSKKL